MLYLLSFLALTLLPSIATATEWQSLTHTQDAELLVDLDSYAENGVHSSILTKNIFKTAQPLPVASTAQAGNAGYFENRVLIEFDCRDKTYHIVKYAYYSRQHKLIYSTPGSNTFVPSAGDPLARVVGPLTCQVRQMVNPQ